MKVIIVVYEDEDKRDNLTTRMVDVRVDSMVAEFTRNDVPIQVIRQKEVKKWEDTRRPCPVKDPVQDKDACRQFGSDACQWNTDALVDCHYVRGDDVDVMDWLHVVDVVKWEVVEKMITDPMIPPATVAYWTKALELRGEGMLTDIEIIKRLKEAD